MKIDKDVKFERSLSVQARIDVTTLARLALYWEEEGVFVKSLSQLVSWSLELMLEVLVANGKVEDRDLRMSDAVRVLVSRGLRQASLTKKGYKRRAMALSFENLRMQKVEPSQYVPQQFSTMHKNKQEIFDGEVSAGRAIDEEEWKNIRKKIDSEKRKEIEEIKRKAIESARTQGILAKSKKVPTVKEKMTDEEFHQKMKEIEERDRERLAFENEALSPENLKKLAKRPSEGGE